MEICTFTVFFLKYRNIITGISHMHKISPHQGDTVEYESRIKQD